MVSLPEARLLLLNEAVAFVAKCCECGLEEARVALLRAFREDTIAARARVPMSRLGRHPSWPEELCDVDVYPEHWYMAVDWENDRVGVSRSVTVERASLEQWLADQPDQSPRQERPAGTSGGEDATRNFLIAEMKANPAKPRSNADLLREVKEVRKFNVSERGFKRAKAAAIAETGAKRWSKAGSKSAH